MAEQDLLVHKRLSHDRAIRILELLPSVKSQDAIQCRLKEFNLDDKKSGPKYEAISYVWGSPTGTFPISCDGKVLLVTENCLTALYQLRRRARARVLWIDAVCIDQAKTKDATDERAVQIPLIGEIYQSASEVIVWLGPDPTHSRILFRLLEVLANSERYLDPWFIPYTLLRKLYHSGVDKLNHTVASLLRLAAQKPLVYADMDPPRGIIFQTMYHQMELQVYFVVRFLSIVRHPLLRNQRLGI
ncbi:Heterokaryon incompatibility protein [Rutstroemia sp. NJR-2017a WRK4]|nr:Heterokaryon incompatibility protein [Rutstroemia sp. NJR-2017a WRK4]